MYLLHPSAALSGFILLGAVTCPAPGVAGETTTLEDLLLLWNAGHGEQVHLAARPMEVDWVGDIRHEDGTVTKLRLDHGGIFQDGPVLVRMRGGSYLGTEGPGYREKLPKAEELRGVGSLAELKKLFGDPMPVIDGWDDGGRVHWNANWVCFTREAAERLRYLGVSTSVSRASGGRRNAPARVDRMAISEGILRPADPDSEAELLDYATGRALWLADEAEKKRQRGKYPQPLRSLVAARDHPGDSDLVHWRAHLNGIRKAPDPRLFRQLIDELDEGTSRMKGAFRSIMVDGWLELEPWQPGQRAIAVETCIDAMPRAGNDSILEDVVVTLLQMSGGGRIEIQSLDGKGGRRIKVKGSGYSLGGAKNPLPIPEAQSRLREMVLGGGKP